MKTVLLVILLLPCCRMTAQVQKDKTVYFFHGARIITGNSTTPLEDGAFIVAKGMFIQVGKSGVLKEPPNAVKVDLSGKTVIPALIDAHVHIGYVDYRKWTDGKRNYTRDNLIDDLHRAAYFGLAAVFSPGTDIAPLCYEVRDDVLAGKYIDVARWITSGPGLTTPDSAREDTQGQDAYAIATPEQARKAVQELALHHVTVIKVWVNSGGPNKFAKQPMTPETYKAIIDEAHEHNMRVFIHERYSEEAKALIAAGDDGFAHEIDDVGVPPEYLKPPGRTPGPDAALLAMLKTRGSKIFMTLTLPSFPGAEAERFRGPDPLLVDTVPPGPLEMMRNDALKVLSPQQEAEAENSWRARQIMTQEFIATGIRIGMGSDTDHLRTNMIGWGAHDEMEEMVATGMTPASTIVAATKTNANWLGLNDLGEIAPGKTASFVVLDANPLDDIRNTRRIAAVYLAGKKVDREALRAAWRKSWTTKADFR